MASTYLKRTGTTTVNTYTFSAWIKLGTLSSANDTYQVLFSSGNQNILGLYGGSTTSGHNALYHYNNTNLWWTNNLLRDPSSWYHVVAKVSGGTVTTYINGVQTSYATSTFSLGALETTTDKTCVGCYAPSATSFFRGSMSHVHFISGTAYDPSAFGETDTTTGEWKAKTSPSVTYGADGFFILKDGNGITDQSGEGNNFTLGGGTLIDLKDNPDNNFATIQFVGHPGNVTLNNGNLVLDGVNENDWKKAFTSTLGASSGKYYWEVKLGIDGESTTDYNIMGIVRSDKTWTNSNVYSNGGFNGLQSANSAGGLGMYSQTGASMGNALYIGGSSVALTNGDIVMFAVDLDNRKMWVGKNGVWANAGSGGGVGNPSTGANELWGTGEFTDGAIYLPSSSIYYDNSQAYNFGNGYFKTTAVSSAGTPASTPGIFEYDCPTGFQPWSTKGLNA